VIRSFWFRAVTLSVVVSQFLAVPTAIACAAEHTRASSHCDAGTSTDATAVRPDHGAQAPSSCTVSMACRAQAPAVVVTASLLELPADGFAPSADATRAFASYDSSPIPPPPQA
jgi:hypothetical protein